MPYPTPEPGQVWQSRDAQQAPGRRIRIDRITANRVDVTTIANPNRPKRVGSTATLHISTLQKRWRLVPAGAQTMAEVAS